MNFACPFILASASPRRRTMLERLGVRHRCVASDIPEIFDAETSPEDNVCRLALEKARSVAANHPDSIVLGADTVVVLDGVILGKPVDDVEAAAMLRGLSGRSHRVHTGIGLVHPASGRTVAECETTVVTFSAMSTDEIQAYVSTGSPMDKAGSYGIQDDAGAWFISGIEGDFYNVVGLPLHRLYRLVKREFTDLLKD